MYFVLLVLHCTAAAIGIAVSICLAWWAAPNTKKGFIWVHQFRRLIEFLFLLCVILVAVLSSIFFFCCLYVCSVNVSSICLCIYGLHCGSVLMVNVCFLSSSLFPSLSLSGSICFHYIRSPALISLQCKIILAQTKQYTWINLQYWVNAQDSLFFWNCLRSNSFISIISVIFHLVDFAFMSIRCMSQRSSCFFHVQCIHTHTNNIIRISD